MIGPLRDRPAHARRATRTGCSRIPKTAGRSQI